MSINGQLIDLRAGDDAGCGGDWACAVCSDQVESFGLVLVASDPGNQCEYVVDSLNEERVVVAVGVGSRFSRIGDDSLLSQWFAASEELALAEEVCGNNRRSAIEQSNDFVASVA